MDKTRFTFATHLSIVWGVTLAIITLLEWHSLDRDPMRKQILSPFIDRSISAVVDKESAGSTGREPELRYLVEFKFKGLLFLLYFFAPVLAFHAIGWLLPVLRRWIGTSRQ